ncbi:MAG: hypothetical protein P4L84_15315 [Isosphaeraceae bacterium]|nr:hypothetical protein [Isosphaeraceae bacterium]
MRLQLPPVFRLILIGSTAGAPLRSRDGTRAGRPASHRDECLLEQALERVYSDPLTGGSDARPILRPPGPRRATGETDRAVPMDAGDEMLGWSVTRITTITTPERGTFGTAFQYISDAKDALDGLEGSLTLLERGQYVPNEAEHTRWMLDDLDEAVRGLRELLAAPSP